MKYVSLACEGRIIFNFYTIPMFSCAGYSPILVINVYYVYFEQHNKTENSYLYN